MTFQANCTLAGARRHGRGAAESLGQGMGLYEQGDNGVQLCGFERLETRVGSVPISWHMLVRGPWPCAAHVPRGVSRHDLETDVPATFV